MEVATKYQSHLSALLACIAVTSGTVLELGVGHFSTPQLHALCGALNRRVISVEADDEWRSYFGNRYEGIRHWFKRDLPVPGRWAVAFIDHSPGGKNRADAFAHLIDVSDYVVVHDYHDENEDAIKPLLDGIGHFVCTDYFPPTLVASRTCQIPGVLR